MSVRFILLVAYQYFVLFYCCVVINHMIHHYWSLSLLLFLIWGSFSDVFPLFVSLGIELLGHRVEILLNLLESVK